MEKDHGLIIGSSLSGKSYLMNFMIGKIFKDLYDEIILISSSIDSVSGDVFDNIPTKNKTKRLDNKTMAYITDYSKKNPTKSFLIVLDDLNKMLAKVGNSDEKKLAQECESNIIYLYTEGRHNNLYTFSLVQYYKQLKPIIRSNSRYQIVTFANNTTCELLFESVNNCFEDIKQLKLFVKKHNVPYKKINGKDYLTSILFDCYNKSRSVKDCVTLLKP